MHFYFCPSKNNCYLCTAVEPQAFSTMIVLWCNGSTAVFGSACLGSNPGKTTQRRGCVKKNRHILLLLSHTLNVPDPARRVPTFSYAKHFDANMNTGRFPRLYGHGVPCAASAQAWRVETQQGGYADFDTSVFSFLPYPAEFFVFLHSCFAV